MTKPTNAAVHAARHCRLKCCMRASLSAIFFFKYSSSEVSDTYHTRPHKRPTTLPRRHSKPIWSLVRPNFFTTSLDEMYGFCGSTGMKLLRANRKALAKNKKSAKSLDDLPCCCISYRLA